MARKLSASKAADLIGTLVRAGHYDTAEDAIKQLPELKAGLKEYNRRQQAARPVGSGPDRLSR